MERDIRVWNNKTYIDKPVILKEDKLISQHRKLVGLICGSDYLLPGYRWYKQFYSEGSVRRAQYSLDW